MTYKTPKLSEIEWVEVDSCNGWVRAMLCTCIECGRDRVIIDPDGGFLGRLMFIVNGAEDARNADSNKKWPYIVEQLVAEGVLK